jgi:hypothetical protein
MIVDADDNLYKSFSDFNFKKEETNTISEKINYYSSLMWNIAKNSFIDLWMIFFLFIAFYRSFLYLSGNDSARLGALIITLIFMMVIQALIGKIPFKGVYKFLSVTWSLI